MIGNFKQGEIEKEIQKVSGMTVPGPIGDIKQLQINTFHKCIALKKNGLSPITLTIFRENVRKN